MNLFKLVIEVTIGLIIATFTAAMFLEWAVGCGESYTDAKGVVHINECIFLVNVR